MEKNNLENEINSDTTVNKIGFGKKAGIAILGSLMTFAGGLAAKNDTVGEWLANTYFNTKKAVLEKMIDWRKSDLEKQWAQDPETNPNLLEVYDLDEDDFGNAFTPELEKIFSEAQGFKQVDGELVNFSGSKMYDEIVDSYKSGKLDELTTEFSRENQSTKLTVVYTDGSETKYFVADKDGEIEENIHFELAKASGDYEITDYNDPIIDDLNKKIKEAEETRETLYDKNPHWDDGLRAVPEYRVNFDEIDNLNEFMYGNEEHQGLLNILKDTKTLTLTEKARNGQPGTIEKKYSGDDVAKYVEGYVFDKIPGRDKVDIESVKTLKNLQGNGGYLIMRLDTDGDGKADRTWSFDIKNDNDFYSFHEVLSFY